jgi:hypothetical protein
VYLVFVPVLIRASLMVPNVFKMSLEEVLNQLFVLPQDIIFIWLLFSGMLFSPQLAKPQCYGNSCACPKGYEYDQQDNICILQSIAVPASGRIIHVSFMLL